MNDQPTNWRIVTSTDDTLIGRPRPLDNALKMQRALTNAQRDIYAEVDVADLTIPLTSYHVEPVEEPKTAALS